MEGKTWEEFREDLSSHNQNPYCTAIALPAELDFMLPEPENFVYPTIEEHRAFTRFFICLWYYQDDNFIKPLYLFDGTTFDEIRMLSGIPIVEGLFIEDKGTEAFREHIWQLYAAAGDLEFVSDLIDA